jgi:ketosteroid isomerase-like protein
LLAHSQERPQERRTGEQERRRADETDTIRVLEEQERKAVLDQDIAALERLWSEQLIVNNPQNQVSASRRDVLERVKRGLIRYSKIERRIEAIRQNEDIVIVMGSEEIVPIAPAPRAGQTTRRRFTSIWKKKAGTWQLIARHANVISSE